MKKKIIRINWDGEGEDRKKKNGKDRQNVFRLSSVFNIACEGTERLGAP